MSLPAEKIAELRQAIHCQVSKMGIQEQIQRCLADSHPLDETGVLELLERRGVVDRVMQSLQLGGGGGEGGGGGGRGGGEGGGGGGGRGGRGGGGGGRGRGGGGGDRRWGEENECGGDEQRGKERGNEEVEYVRECVSDDHLDHRTGEETPRKGPHPNKRYILLRVDGGRAFLDHLQHSHTLCSTTLTLHISFRGQRVHSRPVPCACEPDFSEGFLLELADGRGGREGEGRIMSYSDALSISEPICLVITSTNERGERDLLGTYDLHWRSVLSEERGKLSCTAELNGVRSEAKISAGLLALTLEVFPKATPLQGVFLSAHRETERLQSAERRRLFLVYSKQWWKEFLQIRPEHGQRMVKIFAQDETGRSRPVCSFVSPLRAGRLLDGPRHAARFVSLIPFERSSSLVGRGGGGGEIWCSLHTLLSQRKGDVEDHCTLLCSLLLGYGLETYVCVGTKARGLAHGWVATVGSDGTVTFWESLTGQRYRHVTFDPNTQAGTPPPSPNHPYRTIGCLFNHISFFANAQPTDSLLTCSFDIRNRSLWKPMSSEAIQSVVRHRQNQLPCTLLPPISDPLLTANTMELELRALLTQHRSDLGLDTVWDDALCYRLSPALASYELERSMGVSAGNEEFQDAVRGHVHEGHTFKGFPIQLTHMRPRQAFSTSLRSPVCSEIASCRGDQVRMAVRVKVYCYPEDITAVWIMFPSTYRSIL